MRRVVRGACTMLLAALCCMSAARAADPQPYRVDLAPTGNGSLDATLHATSELIARARGDVDRLKKVMESYGYYQSSVAIQIDGTGLGDPGLADSLGALPANRDARVAVGFQLGPLYHVGTVTIEGALPASAEGLLAL